MTQPTITLAVSGLSCGKCVRKLREGLEALSDAHDVQVSKIRVSVSGSVTREAVVAVIEGLGYWVAESKQYHFNLEGLSCGRCVAKVEEALSARDDVITYTADTTHLSVETSSEPAVMITLIESLGYEATIAQDGQMEGSESDFQSVAASASSDVPLLKDDRYQYFLLDGMTCASCVSSVEKAIAGVSGVSDVRVNLAERSAAVSGDFSTQAVEEAVKEAGYGAEHSDDAQTRRQRLQEKQTIQYARDKRGAWLALSLGAPLMLWGIFGGSMVVNSPTQQWVWGMIGGLTLLLLMTVGRHYFIGAWQALKHSRATMDSLIALGTGAAWLYSMAVVIAPDGFPEGARHVYFEATAMILGLVTLGHAIESRARSHTSRALDRLMDLQPQTALVIDHGGEKEVPLSSVTAGMMLRLKPGMKVAVDGEVCEGQSYLDESMLTGEPIAVAKEIGDDVYAGTINQSGTLVFRATHIGSETTLARIISLVRQAQTSKPALAHLADRISAVFVPLVMVIALLTAVAWWLWGPEPKMMYALISAVSVLIIACPCALGLATPLSVTIGVGRAADLGVLVRDAAALQLGASIDTVVLDKTGTLTVGSPQVVTQTATNGDTQALLALAASLEQASEHPFAQAIINAAEDEGLALASIEAFQAESGKGIQAMLDGEVVALGNAAMMMQVGVDVEKLQERVKEMSSLGQTPVYVARGGALLGVIGINDPLREDSTRAVHVLHDMGLRVVMLSGDIEATAQAIAKQLGIDEVIAGVLPEGKAQVIKRLQAEGHSVAMVGDGINDGPALAQAEVGMAMGGGNDVAIESAQFTLMRHSVVGVVDALALSRATLRNMKGNLFGAFIYNSLGIPIAAGVLYPLLGVLLSPVIAGGAMALSSITVVSNANRLRLFRSPMADKQ
ncbi:copper-translocating P-type ATPase [Suttonella sp. R2A3]|uniref:copper-translocating P-type ATPase n=1 Tax=Suttonella sp. R2A3 TaxID=2908648 RepID=UPI001F3FED0A|nr:copper-translocating P-type ATPase [Suttonella sp. R2A3]UJF24397.1 copper-translocating P-type ATPase [Suttonella sp. R2A3]